MKRFTSLLAAALLTLLVACAQLGLAPAKSFDDGLAYAYSNVAAIRLSTAQAVMDGTLDKDDGKSVLDHTDMARQVLDGARQAESAGNMQEAQGRLAMVMNVLAQMHAYLASKGVK